jgi:hypothetical protein
MRVLKSILAMLAVVSLMSPCVHAEGHRHELSAEVGLTCSTHSNCHCNSEETCAKPMPIALSMSQTVMDVPPNRIRPIRIPEQTRFRPVEEARLLPAANLLCLRTIQLLI